MRLTLTTWEKAEGRKCWLAGVGGRLGDVGEEDVAERARELPRVGRPKVSLIYGAAGGERASRQRTEVRGVRAALNPDS